MFPSKARAQIVQFRQIWSWWKAWVRLKYIEASRPELRSDLPSMSWIQNLKWTQIIMRRVFILILFDRFLTRDISVTMTCTNPQCWLFTSQTAWTEGAEWMMGVGGGLADWTIYPAWKRIDLASNGAGRREGGCGWIHIFYTYSVFWPPSPGQQMPLKHFQINLLKDPKFYSKPQHVMSMNKSAKINAFWPKIQIYVI